MTRVRIHGMGGVLPNLALQGPRTFWLLVFTQPTMPSLANISGSALL